MDWVTLTVGAITGALAGLLLQNILFPHTQARLSARLRRRKYEAANKEWVAIQGKLKRLQLVQAGWNEDFCFTDGSVILRDTGIVFNQANLTVNAFRAAHSQQWLDSGFTNGRQLGFAKLLIGRRSDNAEDERLGVWRIRSLSMSMNTSTSTSWPLMYYASRVPRTRSLISMN